MASSALTQRLRRLPCSKQLCLDAFAWRQFAPEQKESITSHIDCDPVVFMNNVLAYHEEHPQLSDGYADFCKHIFMPSFIPSLRAGYIQITDANRHLLYTAYVARTEKELPVLRRYFDSSMTGAEAQWLDIILYSREQIVKENAAMGNDSADGMTSEWGIISVKPQTVSYELPMDPITMMRNALGVEEGGSGVPLNREAYMKSVKFWEQHAAII